NTFLPLLKDGDPLVRRYAIEGIRKLPLEQSFIPLLHALAESNLTVQASIRRILLPLGNDVLKEKFNLLFQRNNPKLRWLVVMAMERLPLSYPELMHRATTDQNERVRQQAKRTLAIKVKTGSKSLVSDKT
ncbi:HEAT repeat domain-containing protein, partial [candidate division KSB1 bacterium]|nr:HEAT repeat domain-containing protein [candidate division KSB1 bacterium]